MVHEHGEEVEGRIEGRYWVFTWNDFDLEEAIRVLTDAADHEDVTYICAGQEVGAEEGRLHLQGYLELRVKRRRQRVSTMLGGHCWLGRRYKKSSGAAAATYAKKDGCILFEAGEIETVTQGSRTDLDTIRERIQEGATELEIATEHFGQWCYHRKSFEVFRDMINAPPHWRDVECVMLWGKTETGKSHYVRKYKYPGAYNVASKDLKWWNGYTNQETIVIEEYRGQADESMLLEVLDGYALQLPTKGGFTWAKYKRVFITSNINPGQLHNFPNPESRAAFKRRFKAVIQFRERMEMEEIDRLIDEGEQDWGYDPYN